MPPKVSVVVPTFRRPERLPELLGCLAAQTAHPSSFEVLIVDNFSQDDTSEVLEGFVDKMPFRLRPLRTDHNAGPAPARNLGWRSAQASYVAFMDDDCAPEPEWLERGLAAIEAAPKVGVVQGSTLPPTKISSKDYGDHYVWREVRRPTPYFEACNIFYRREALEQSGGFDETIGWWGEDTAAGWRVIENGWERGFAEDAVVRHPVERRGWVWHIKTGLLDENLVRLAAEYPGFRREAFWKPWAYRRDDAAFVGALASLLLALRWRPAILGVLPYCWWRRPSVRRPAFLRLSIQLPFIDLARLIGRIRGAIKHRVFVV